MKRTLYRTLWLWVPSVAIIVGLSIPGCDWFIPNRLTGGDTLQEGIQNGLPRTPQGIATNADLSSYGKIDVAWAQVRDCWQLPLDGRELTVSIVEPDMVYTGGLYKDCELLECPQYESGYCDGGYYTPHLKMITTTPQMNSLLHELGEHFFFELAGGRAVKAGTAYRHETIILTHKNCGIGG